MPKKKKAAVNTGRGFATTSVASKPKPHHSESGTETPETSQDVSKNATGNATGSASPATQKGANAGPPDQEAEKSRELHELSPEELERRLEEADLQTFVEKHSARTARESSRCVDKMQIECRLLKNQAVPLNIRSLIPDELLLKLAALAKEDIDEGRRFADEIPSKTSPSDDDLTARIWTLQRTLAGIGFSNAQVDAALRYVLRAPPTRENESAVWALDEALDWLCCSFPEEDLPIIDPKTGSAVVTNVSQSDPQAPLLKDENGDDEDAPKKKRRAAKNAKPSGSPASEAKADDFEVSDLGSDLEPDELQAAYLRTKSRLFEFSPDLAPAVVRGSKHKKQPSKAAQTSKSNLPAGAQKLQEKIRKIEQDALFDQGEADMQWSNHRVLLAREQAERKRLQLPERSGADQSSTHDEKDSTTPGDDAVQEIATRPNEAQEEQGVASDPIDGKELGPPASDSEDDTAFGDLFAAVANDDSRTERDITAPDYRTLKIRDFGQTKGVEPRRILEEACKAKDSGHKIRYKLSSSTAFANRHSLIVTWSKDQALNFPLEFDAVESVQSSRQVAFTMKNIATPDAYQSLAYISVFALFQIFSSSSKEEKASLRLPPNWRNLWSELAETFKSQSESRERSTIQKLRELVAARDKGADSDDEDVIFTKNFKKRHEASQRDSRGDFSAPLDHIEQRLQNLWQEKSATPQYQNYQRIRTALPMWQFKDAATSTVDQNQVTILCGETGCGKSTQMPAFILEHQLSLGKHCKIYCTEPRRISAITLAQRVSEEFGEAKKELGGPRSFVGYSIRLESHVSSSTRLVYATTGVVLRMLENREALADITHIVIDEVHERSIETDFLLIILKSLCVKRPELKVILMSATVDADRFAKYFSGAPVLIVPGRTFPVETKYLEDAIELTGHAVDEDDQTADIEDDEVDAEAADAQVTKPSTAASHFQAYSKKTRDALAKLDHYSIDYKLIIALIETIASNPLYQKYNRAILVFLPGIAEIRRMADMLTGSRVAQQYLVHSLHSSIASEDQQAAFQIPPHGLGKIVLSTNIAETGVTIPDVTCVLDTGQHREMRFDERRQISRLLNCSISRANAKQRRGRAGRVQEGLCFHLFTKPRHDEKMAEQQTPEMLRLSLQDLIMRVKICNLGNIQATLAEALDPPSSKNIRRAIDALIEVGALTAQEELTSLGRQLSKLPLDPYLGKLVLYGAFFGCLDVCLTLAAILTSKSPFVSPIGARKQADYARTEFRRGDSDLLTEFNAYSSWKRVCSTTGMSELQFCRRNFLSHQNLANVEDLKSQLMSAIADAGFVALSSEDRRALSRIQNTSSRSRRFVAVPAELNNHSTNTEAVQSVIAWAFYPKLLSRDGKGWRNVATNQSISIHPTSIIRQAPSSSFGSIKFLSFYSILQSSGTKTANANSLSPVNGVSFAVLGGTASFQPTAHVISVDHARMRFAIDAPRQRVWGDIVQVDGTVTSTVVGVWKTHVALKYLRRRMDEAMRRRWRRPDDRLSGLLCKWMDAWNEIMAHWKGADS